AGEIHAGEPYPRVPVRLTLPAGATVSSFVAAERGEETAHARLHVDSSGNGILTHLAPGRWTVHFDVNGRRRSVEVDVREGAPPVTIDFTR
ncbi:MAG: hypothetical protein OER88_05880, partial [Planctomycetota bacterium]|nr:hypothetical protein [Planctomycetota bacterium]